MQTAKEELVIRADKIDESQQTNLSLMPEGQLNTMSGEDVRDLISYFQSSQQARLAE